MQLEYDGSEAHIVVESWWWIVSEIMFWTLRAFWDKTFTILRSIVLLEVHQNIKEAKNKAHRSCNSSMMILELISWLKAAADNDCLTNHILDATRILPKNLIHPTFLHVPSFLNLC